MAYDEEDDYWEDEPDPECDDDSDTDEDEEPVRKKKKVASKLTPVERKEGMSRFEARSCLRQHNYCLKHLVPKTDTGKRNYVCMLCLSEEEQEKQEKIKKAIRVLGGTPKLKLVEMKMNGRNRKYRAGG